MSIDNKTPVRDLSPAQLGEGVIRVSMSGACGSPPSYMVAFEAYPGQWFSREHHELEAVSVDPPDAGSLEPTPAPRMRVRTKPQFFETEQFLGFGQGQHVPEGVAGRVITWGMDAHHLHRVPIGTRYVVVCTPDGDARITEGDWVLTDAQGKHWACPAADFDKLYEPVEANAVSTARIAELEQRVAELEREWREGGE